MQVHKRRVRVRREAWGVRSLLKGRVIESATGQWGTNAAGA
jgi:hypothetical protein